MLSHAVHALTWTTLAWLGVGTVWAYALRRMYARTLSEDELWNEFVGHPERNPVATRL